MPHHPPFFLVANQLETSEDKEWGYATLKRATTEVTLSSAGEEQAKITWGWEVGVGHPFLFGWIHLGKNRQTYILVRKFCSLCRNSRNSGQGTHYLSHSDPGPKWHICIREDLQCGWTNIRRGGRQAQHCTPSPPRPCTKPSLNNCSAYHEYGIYAVYFRFRKC